MSHDGLHPSPNAPPVPPCISRHLALAPFTHHVAYEGFSRGCINGPEWWPRLAAMVPSLHTSGMTMLLLPPLSKGYLGKGSYGYDPCDYYDFGGVDQFGTVATAYGLEESLRALLRAARRCDMHVVCDLVAARCYGGEEEILPGEVTNTDGESPSEGAGHGDDKSAGSAGGEGGKGAEERVADKGGLSEGCTVGEGRAKEVGKGLSEEMEVEVEVLVEEKVASMVVEEKVVSDGVEEKVVSGMVEEEKVKPEVKMVVLEVEEKVVSEVGEKMSEEKVVSEQKVEEETEEVVGEEVGSGRVVEKGVMEEVDAKVVEETVVSEAEENPQPENMSKKVDVEKMASKEDNVEEVQELSSGNSRVEGTEMPLVSEEVASGEKASEMAEVGVSEGKPMTPEGGEERAGEEEGEMEKGIDRDQPEKQGTASEQQEEAPESRRGSGEGVENGELIDTEGVKQVEKGGEAGSDVGCWSVREGEVQIDGEPASSRSGGSAKRLVYTRFVPQTRLFKRNHHCFRAPLPSSPHEACLFDFTSGHVRQQVKTLVKMLNEGMSVTGIRWHESEALPPDFLAECAAELPLTRVNVLSPVRRSPDTTEVLHQQLGVSDRFLAMDFDLWDVLWLALRDTKLGTPSSAVCRLASGGIANRTGSRGMLFVSCFAAEREMERWDWATPDDRLLGYAVILSLPAGVPLISHRDYHELRLSPFVDRILAVRRAHGTLSSSILFCDATVLIIRVDGGRARPSQGLYDTKGYFTVINFGITATSRRICFPTGTPNAVLADLSDPRTPFVFPVGHPERAAAAPTVPTVTCDASGLVTLSLPSPRGYALWAFVE